MQTCPLCAAENASHYHSDKKRDYLQCPRCQLVFVPAEQRLDARAEKAVYDLHNNDPSDAGYRRFLSRLASPLSERLPQGSMGLDFGCGPGPTLSVMFEEKGFPMSLYDLYYYPESKALESKYDFVTATEVIEHLYQPNKIWQQWLALIKPGGYLGLMTKMVIDVDAFSTWHYKSDQTHVVFFSRATFLFLAKRDGLEIEFIGNDVILLRKLT
ncbi:class I SAM-dependent methyltransferase [Vibrio sp. ZSDZ65]|uniref:Class I SAM-dependent methyltransferase n=1 Tax=Vibrio qingdaonensis TaxID=2829491 RepID=A0A9X3HYJ5_9VIBR|nr:class I SAM-dependent methyltransferase [Vibrio qingdaonensis]MCW8348454.1 class I SAM-dependent methyltransferase [Vibrio qingdaonensis]